MKIQNAFRVGLIGTLGVGLGVLILTSVVALSTILTYVGAALFIALGLDPFVSWLEKRNLPRWAALLITVVLVLGVFVGLVFAVVPAIVSQTSALIARVPTLLEDVGRLEWLEALKHQFPALPLDDMLLEIGKFFSDPKTIAAITGGVLQAGVAIANGFFGALIVLILTLYFTASLGSIKRGMYQLIPASKRERFADLSEQITSSVGRYVIGQVTLAACNGILSFIFLSIINGPFPAVLACVAFFFSLIPLVGSLTGSILIVLICLGLGSPITALVAGIYYLVYMQVEAYVLSPNIMKRAVQVPGALVVIAALAGGSLLGLLGALVAIPAAAAALLIVKQVVIPRQNEL
ncbi:MULTISPECIES: AI-2E family transporter [unclassified Plantibacter]|uniref:AI-2E family transporter n=1 Tax=unclassified Plantibacter TaxID=2624265 RepID=UPI003D348A9D